MFRKSKRLLAGFLAVLMAASAAQSFAFGAEIGENAGQAVTVQAEPQLQNGTAVIPEGSDKAAVNEILSKALIANYDQVGTQEWEYYCEGKDKTTGLAKNSAWGSIAGFESQTGSWIKVTYIHPALANNEDGTYQVRLAGTEAEVTLTKAAKLSSSITLNEGVTVTLPYNEDLTVNYDAMRTAIFNTVVASTTPELSVSDVVIEYYAENVVLGKPAGTHEWAPLEGATIKNALGIPLEYPAISTGEQKIRISYAGTDTIYGTSAETTVTVAERPEADVVFNDGPYQAKLTVKEDLSVDYDALRQAIFTAAVKSSTPELTVNDVTIEYYTKALTDADAKWVALEGEKGTILNYPAISAGEQKVRIVWGGSQNYAPTTKEFTVTIADREQVQFNLNEGPYEVGMVFDDEQGYNYDATAAAIYNAVVASTTPVAFAAEDVAVEYNADPTGITSTFKPLDYTDLGGLVKFGTGEWKIRISVADTQAYRGNSVIVTVTTTDNRAASSVVCKEGVSITYNMDANVMKQALFDNVIDWENSTLPAKDTLSIDNFTFEYYGENVLTDNINGGVKQWAPIEGGTVTLLNYPQMGAADSQQIRISFKGNADYRPSEAGESTITVNKAKVSVKVNSTNIYADEQLPANFVTTNPTDKFDIYTIYAGTTSDVTTSLYLDLPDRYTSNAILKILDPVVEAISGKTFTQMLNDGVTVGELRELFSTQELLDLLDKLNIDTGTFGQILTVINKLPSVVDTLRISFGTPNRAGLYTVAAVTDNKNYETGVGIGFLLVKMRLSGSKLTWNEEISGKMTVEEAKNFDFGATLSHNGDVTVSQSNVHYLYSGFTSNWRIYSSTTTPPTEPGSYVMTVVTLGGNYLAAPITRTFTIK